MNVKELKKRWLRGYVQPELFYLPFNDKDDDLHGDSSLVVFLISPNVYDYNIKDYERYDSSPTNGAIVVKNKNDKIIFNSKSLKNNYRFDINNIPDGEYSIKVIRTEESKIDNIWHKVLVKKKQVAVTSISLEWQIIKEVKNTIVLNTDTVSDIHNCQQHNQDTWDYVGCYYNSVTYHSGSKTELFENNELKVLINTTNVGTNTIQVGSSHGVAHTVSTAAALIHSNLTHNYTEDIQLQSIYSQPLAHIKYKYSPMPFNAYITGNLVSLPYRVGTTFYNSTGFDEFNCRDSYAINYDQNLTNRKCIKIDYQIEYYYLEGIQDASFRSGTYYQNLSGNVSPPNVGFSGVWSVDFSDYEKEKLIYEESLKTNIINYPYSIGVIKYISTDFGNNSYISFCLTEEELKQRIEYLSSNPDLINIQPQRKINPTYKFPYEIENTKLYKEYKKGNQAHILEQKYIKYNGKKYSCIKAEFEINTDYPQSNTKVQGYGYNEYSYDYNQY